MDTMGVGIIGCGMISGNHFHALSKLSHVSLRAVCDIDEEKLEKAAKEQHAQGYTSWRELIARSDIDSVHICVPHYLHAEIAIAALGAGKHVLCEKPMGVSLAEAQAMEAAARDAGKTLTVCFQNRYNGASQRMKEVIEEGTLGKLLGGSAFVAWNRAEPYYVNSPWRGRWETEGGSVLINQAIHTLDLLRFLAGDLKLSACTMSAKRLAETIETEDTCDMLLQGPDGERYLFYASNCGVSNLPVQMHLTFEKGEMHLHGALLTIKGPEGTVTEDYTTALAVGKDYWGSGHGPFIEDFYRRLLAGDPPYITPADGRETTRLMEEAYTQAMTVRRRPT
ncbi:MAG: Gfo/Idh/MocA family oxidoreductase [Clostridia bacterium]|nr:Gfo/Idh/MocA family oxidoreductase [Clostridia bacterium]